MKKILISLLFGLSVINANAQIYQQGSRNINLGLGLGYGLGATVSGEIGLTELISVGVAASYSTRSYGNFVGYNYRVNYLTVGARGSLHLNKFLSEPLNYSTDKMDLYVGLSPYFRKVSFGGEFKNYYAGVASGISIGGYAGGRYHFKQKMGVYAELGVPYSNLGLTFKL